MYGWYWKQMIRSWSMHEIIFFYINLFLFEKQQTVLIKIGCEKKDTNEWYNKIKTQIYLINKRTKGAVPLSCHVSWSKRTCFTGCTWKEFKENLGTSSPVISLMYFCDFLMYLERYIYTKTNSVEFTVFCCIFTFISTNQMEFVCSMSVPKLSTNDLN